MPKRIVDGEALWTSSKVRKLPLEFRLHYANWLPLAAANGVFEIDLDNIRSRVYAASLDSDMTSGLVFVILRAFVTVGLVKIWHEDDKMWGYFNGIDKAGRLPGGAVLKRYTDLPPMPPVDDTEISRMLEDLKSLNVTVTQ